MALHQLRRTASLPVLRFDDGDVIVRLFDDAQHALLIHSEVVKTHCPGIAPFIKEEWTAPQMVHHPNKGEDVKVFTLYLKVEERDKTFLLDNQEPARPDEAALSEQYHFFFDESPLCGEGWPTRPGLGAFMHTYHRVREAISVSLVVIFAVAYGIEVPLETWAGKIHSQEGKPAYIHQIVDSVSAVCALADYYNCLPMVAKALSEQLMDHPLFWQTVADKPGKYLLFGENLRCDAIYLDALRHVIACSPTYERLANRLDLETAKEAREKYGWVREDVARANVEFQRSLAKIQLHKSWAYGNDPAEPNATRTVWTTFLNALKFMHPKRSETVIANERADYLARGIFGQWFAQQIAGEKVFLEGQRQMSKAAGPLPLACEKLLEANRMGEVGSLFGGDAQHDLTGIFKLDRSFVPPKQVVAALRQVVAEAAEVVESAFPVKTERIGGVKHTFRRARGDQHCRIFVYAAVDEEAVPWDGRVDWAQTETVANVGMQELSEGYWMALGL